MTDSMSSKKWTSEQLQNAMLYMTCFVCRAPREARIVQYEENGKTNYESRVVCPNGHPQN